MSSFTFDNNELKSVKKITEEQFRLTSVQKLAVKLNYQHDENSHAVFFKEWSIFYLS